MTDSPLSPRPPLDTSVALLVAGIALVSLNLRPAIAVVGPIAGDIRLGAGLSSASVGLLTTLPLLAFGLVSMLTPLLTRRLGIGRTLLGALLVLALATGLRAVPGPAFLFGGTIILGIAIALGNVLLPALVKRDFSPAQAGPMTSLYSSGIGLGAAAGSRSERAGRGVAGLARRAGHLGRVRTGRARRVASSDPRTDSQDRRA